MHLLQLPHRGSRPSYTRIRYSEIQRAPANGPQAVGVGAVDTIYIGGGTPSLLEPSALARIITAIREHFSVAQDLEVTLEADPETITAVKSEAWRQGGINRISLGVQSFNDAELKATGRMHRANDVSAAVSALRRSGFANISADLIAGMPHQTPVTWQQSLGELQALCPDTFPSI